MNLEELKDYGFRQIGHLRTYVVEFGIASILIVPDGSDSNRAYIYFRIDRTQYYKTLSKCHWEIGWMDTEGFIAALAFECSLLQNTEIYSEQVTQAFSFQLQKVEESMEEPHIKVFNRLRKVHRFTGGGGLLTYFAGEFVVFVQETDDPFVLAWFIRLGDTVVGAGDMRFSSAAAADQLVTNIGHAMKRWVSKVAQDALLFAQAMKGA